MLPPVSTRSLQASLEKQRRADAALRWSHALRGERAPTRDASRDIPTARPRR